MTAKQMNPAIGQSVEIAMEGLSVAVRVMDVKSAYGRVRMLVAPLAGRGEIWVDLARVRRVAEVLNG